jgi:hypothetical protein
MEELRPILADRLALTLINRRQLTDQDFDRGQGGAVLLMQVIPDQSFETCPTLDILVVPGGWGTRRESGCV